MRLGLITTRVRQDEKMLIRAAERRGVHLVRVRDRDLVLDAQAPPDHGVAGYLDRTLSLSRSLATTAHLEAHGVPVVNRHAVVQACGDKWATSLRLARAGVPTPRTLVAYDEASALEALERVGYPAVMKPTVGSWGRLVTRVDSPEHARSLIEHKRVLGGPQHGVLYVQALVDKPGRDIRAFIAGDRVVAAIYRENDQHWITNTAQGGRATNCPVTPELEDVCLRAADAVGGGLLAMDLMEDPEEGLVVHEANHCMEFKNSVAPTGVDIPGAIIEHAVEVVKA